MILVHTQNKVMKQIFEYFIFQFNLIVGKFVINVLLISFCGDTARARHGVIKIFVTN